MSDLMGQLSQALAAIGHRLCACGHEAQAHEYQSCTTCDCDIRRFEVEQGCVEYVDSGERISLAEHHERRLKRIRESA